MIVPGSANPLLLAQSADPLDEFGVVARSIRCRSAASALISRTPGVAGNRQTWAARFYVKRGTLGVFQALMDATPATPATENTWLAFTATDQLQFCQQTANVHVGEKVTNRVFRDTAAHIEIEIVFDSTNAVAADRMRIYINGVRETSFATSVDIAQNALSYVNAANVHYIGGAPGTGIGYFDGLISSVVITDGTMPDPSVFGQVHARTGQRRPKSKAAIKAIADAGGTNSVFLTFDDPTNTTTLCADASSKGNNWTSTNISLTAGITYDSLIDTPTNNFPVLNATYAAYGTAAGNITEGGLKFASSSTYHFTPCTIPLPAKGQWVAEFVPQDTVSIIGLADLDNGSGSSQNIGSGLGWYGSILYTGNASAVQSGLATQAANDIITVAVDMDALSAKWYQNGVLRITQALTAGKRYAFACGDYYAPGATSCFANFGQRAFSYAPNGYKALSTKNLPVNPGGPMKSTNAFVAVADTGVNILSTLAAARSGWSSYIDIIKRRDTAEGWRLIFSDDPTYYLDWSGVAAKAAIPAFGGTSYGGVSLKVG
ncbi:MAG TPA: hypothetical protein VK165_00350, partial [Azonexus sp.]|nr:hypothetical protein [Azonexus sp.]